MDIFKDRRVVIGLGGAAALVAGLVFAFVLLGGNSGPKSAPPASKGGLQVDVADPRPVELERELRCFVDGQFVGLATLKVCAEKNGVAAQALDVGIDESGALIAAETASLAPPPGAPSAGAPQSPEVIPGVAAGEGPTAVCLRHINGEWRRLSDALTLNACVQLLYNGRCERPGGAMYGRWGEVTLRLVPGRVERSSDNVVFTRLVEQGRSCTVPILR